MKSCLQCIHRKVMKDDGFSPITMGCTFYRRFKLPVKDDEEFCKHYKAKQKEDYLDEYYNYTRRIG